MWGEGWSDPRVSLKLIFKSRKLFGALQKNFSYVLMSEAKKSLVWSDSCTRSRVDNGFCGVVLIVRVF